MKALEHHSVPPYLVAIVSDYIRGRVLEFRDKERLFQSKGASCGISQRSMLGPFFWNIGYDALLSAVMQMTLWSEETTEGSCSHGKYCGFIEGMRLKVALQKTEAMFIHYESLDVPAQIREDQPPFR